MGAAETRQYAMVTPMNHGCRGVYLSVLAGCVALAMNGCRQRDAYSARADFFPLHAEDTWVYEIARPADSVRTHMTVRVRGERYIQALGRPCRLVEESYRNVFPAVELPEGGPGPELYPIAFCRTDGFLSRARPLEYRGEE